MEESFGPFAMPVTSETEFSIILQLAESPPSPMNDGLKQWKQLYELARDGSDIRGTVFALQNIFSGLTSIGRTREALVCARRLLGLGQETGDPLIVGHALNNIASAYWVMGDHVAAHHMAEVAIRHAKGLSAKPLLHPFTGPEAIRKMATDLLHSIRLSRRELRRAIADQEAMLQVHRACGDIRNVICSMEGLGLVHKDLGNNDQAVHWFEAALQETANADIPDGRTRLLMRAGLLGNLGVVLTNADNTSDALGRIEEALAIYSALSDAFGQIGALGQKGRALLQGGYVSESVDCFEVMLRLARQYDAESWQQAAHFNLARAHLTAGDLSEAAMHCERSVALAEEKLGHAGVDLHWLRAALFHPHVAMRRSADPAVYTTRFIALGYYALRALHQNVRGAMPSTVINRWFDEFEALIQAALHLPATIPFRIPSDEQAGAPSLRDGARAALSTIALASPFVGWLPLDIALYCVEAFRAQEFQEQLLLNAADLEHRHDPRVVSELAEIEADLQKLQDSPPIVVVGTAAFDGDGNLVRGESESESSIRQQSRAQEEYLQRRAGLLATRDTLAAKTIELSDTPVAPLQEPVRLSDLRGVLRDDELFLEFVLLGQTDDGKRFAGEIVQLPDSARPNGGYVIAITRSWSDVVPLGPSAEIEAQCLKLLDMMDRFGESLSLPFFQSEAALAFDLLLGPVWTRAGAAMESVRHLVIATDGVLNKLSLDLLIEGRGGAGSWRDVEFIARRFSTEYTPSATLLVDSRNGRYRRGEPGRTFVGFGDPAYTASWQPQPLHPLPGTRRELKAIATLISVANERPGIESTRLFMDTEARKDHLSDPELLTAAGYIHLACHASAGKAPYLDGALYLAQTDGADPLQCVITAREVMDLRTNAKLVVMSACESGLGVLTRGEGIQGLARAWMFAGAQAVIASLWEVEDEATAQLMIFLYQVSLRSATSVSDALAAVRRAALDDERLACPALWAPFILFGGRSGERRHTHTTGDGRAITQSSDRLIRAEPQEIPLGSREHALLSECARAWEAAWNTGKPDGFSTFFATSTELAHFLRPTIGADREVNLSDPISLVARNCRVAWEYWTKEHQPALAVRAYQSYIMWVPSARSSEWDALVSAYRPENLHAVRNLTRQGELPRTFDIHVDTSLAASLTTAVTRTEGIPADGLADGQPVEVVIPANAGFISESVHVTSCRDLSCVAFLLRPGETVSITEQLTDCVHVVDNDTFLLHGTWGSTLIPHVITIQLHLDFVPLRLQRKPVSRGSSFATIRFSSGGAIVTLRPSRGPWLERLALMFRRVPGAAAHFAEPNSPFIEDMEFGQFEKLLQEAQRQHGSP